MIPIVRRYLYRPFTDGLYAHRLDISDEERGVAPRIYCRRSMASIDDAYKTGGFAWVQGMRISWELAPLASKHDDKRLCRLQNIIQKIIDQFGGVGVELMTTYH